ncbi:UreD urease accessory protein-domain-containing protein [Radiomyces spectabilis]|uniref:UreD urease accessory protein-domain-containing protein n=1 Tax=Radiomyces spectabilis TaxID=64574 RepID=UPI00221E3D6C|nr:UreD urease accessory protein-domain-containing protein [Radiomyces spectabilis]KAI8394127.1 UreD urease accessory protein-domain-containing protein [Radiomyces spectabilis]
MFFKVPDFHSFPPSFLFFIQIQEAVMKPFASTAVNDPGRGTLICKRQGPETQFVRIHAQYPLKFIPTKAYADRLAVVYMISYGGGIVCGDRFDITMEIQPEAILLLMTQGNTKVFRDRVHQRQWLAKIAQQARPSLPFSSLLPPTPPSSPSSNTDGASLQLIEATVASSATLLIMPDPVTSFRDSSFKSHQAYRLEDTTSQLVLLDWFNSGRLTRGETWAFKHYSSRIDVYHGDRLLLRDHMVLEDEEYMRTDAMQTSYAAKLYPYTCFATLIVVSDGSSSLYRSIEAFQKKAEAERMLPVNVRSRQDILWSVSPLLNGRGSLVRVSGITTEQVRDFIKHQVLGKGLEEIIGSGMFSKVLM